MKSQLFSNAVCATVIASLMCSCASNNDCLTERPQSDPRDAQLDSTALAIGMQGGAVGVLTAAATIEVIKHVHKAHQAAEVREAAGNTEYLPRVGKVASVAPQPKEAKSSKTYNDNSGTQYIVQ